MGRKKKENVVDNKKTNTKENIKIKIKSVKADKPPPKKRGRKPKKKDENAVKPPPKKRGRKPKGGKIVAKKSIENNNMDINEQNVILHLKCTSNDLKNKTFISIPKYDPTIGIEEPESFNFDNKITGLNYGVIKSPNFVEVQNIKVKKEEVPENHAEPKESHMKDIWNKLNKLKVLLRKNNIIEKKSSCFWCTYDFDTPSVYIPKHYNDGKLEVYGCFCSPECAVSYLRCENIDDSTKWERYALLNNVYCKIYNYEKNIKPAPNPFYTLDKYYGNLSITEYRKLLKNDSILLVVNKPMTKIFPELYEENNELPKIYENLLDNNNTKKTTKTTNYRLKRNVEVSTKTKILSNNFNFGK